LISFHQVKLDDLQRVIRIQIWACINAAAAVFFFELNA